TSLLRQLANLDVRGLDERLLNQAGFGQELADTTANHLLDDFGRLAFDLVFVQRQEDFLLLGYRFFGNLRRVEELRVAGRYVHGDFLGQLDVAAFERNQNTDAMAVQVGAHQLTFNRSQTTDVDVLTTLGDQRFALGLLSSDQRSGVGHVLGKGLLNAVIDED